MSVFGSRRLRVFLCHASSDKPAVRELYRQLNTEGWIDTWLDEEKLYPGQDWNLEIEKAVEAADAIIVCLSNNSIGKEGYVQRELRIVLDYANYKPEGTLYIIPVRLEACEPPRRLRIWQYADYFPESERDQQYSRLLQSLRIRAETLGILANRPNDKISTMEQDGKSANSVKQQAASSGQSLYTFGQVDFIKVPAGKFMMGSKDKDKQAYDNEKPHHAVEVPYDYYIARYLITNEQYALYMKAKGISHNVHSWKYKRTHPVVSVSWNDTSEFCTWLYELLKSEIPSDLILRLPTEAEWEKAARGKHGYVWSWGNNFDINRCNSSESGNTGSTPVGTYSPLGDSLYGCADMSGNVWEWTHSIFKEYPYKIFDGRETKKGNDRRVLRGGSFDSRERDVRCACRNSKLTFFVALNLGFRVVIAPHF